MGIFNLLSEHGSSSTDISTSPHWILLVIRYAEPLTASKARLANRTPYHSGNISFDDDISTINRTRPKLLITSDCVSLDIDSAKGRYTQNLQAVLVPGRNYLSEIMPGDWVFAWTMNSRSKFKDVIRRIKAGEPVNGFDDGLKFVGRVQDIRKMLAQTPEGLRTVRYNLAAVGFGELDSAVFFDPHLSRNEQYIERVLQNLSIPLADIHNVSAKEAQSGKGGIDINRIMPELLKAFIGEGVSGIGTESGGLQLAHGAGVATKDAPYAYVVPDGVAQLLGVKSSSKDSGVYSYADILELIQGLQKYHDHSIPNFLCPDGTIIESWARHMFQVAPNRHFTAHPLKGLFMPTAISFDNKTVWSLLSEFLNPAINEMYTAVRYTPSGKVMPTLVIRQLPFSSPVMAEKRGSKVTGFHELPRWKAEPVLVRGMDIGRSDGERVNFVHIYGVPAKATAATEMSQQLILHPPLSDLQDIKRHGLRPHMGQVSVSSVDIVHGGPGEWMALRADFLMGQHLMLTGMASLVGVTAPIAPGDNFEFEDTLFHIEAVHHHCSVSADGRKTFTTQLSLSHGVRADVPMATARIPKKRKVTKKGHIREDRVKRGHDLLLNDRLSNQEVETALGRFGGRDSLDAATRELYDGVEMDELEGGGNPDVYYYSGVAEDDNTSLDPGLTLDNGEED